MATRYHWEDGDEELDIVPLPPQTPSRRAGLALIAGAALVAALAIAGAVIWARAQQGQRTAQSDLQAVVDAETGALQRGDQEVFLSLQDFSERQWFGDQELYWNAVQRASEEEAGADVGGLTITEVELRDDRAWVVVQYTLDGVPYRRAQFYRLLDGHWRHTAPDARFWGGAREIETLHLRFLTNQREEHMVRPVAEALDLLYRQVLSDFALQAPAGQVTFEFRPVAEAGPEMYSEAHFLVPSPLLLGIRSGDRLDQDLLGSLAQSVGLYLAIEKSGLYVGDPGPGSSWVMLKGVVAWEVEQRLLLPVVPVQWTELLQEAAAADTLPPVSALWPPYQFHTESDSAVAFVQAQSVVDYAVELRGLDVLPAFVEALGARLTPEETIRAAVQVDLASFEEGWRAYLRGRPTVVSAGLARGVGVWRYGLSSSSLAAWQPSEGLLEHQVSRNITLYCRPCAGSTCPESDVCFLRDPGLFYRSAPYPGG